MGEGGGAWNFLSSGTAFRFVPVLGMSVYEDYCAIVVLKVSNQGL
jgi:hypothetical protein